MIVSMTSSCIVKRSETVCVLLTMMITIVLYCRTKWDCVCVCCGYLNIMLTIMMMATLFERNGVEWGRYWLSNAALAEWGWLSCGLKSCIIVSRQYLLINRLTKWDCACVLQFMHLRSGGRYYLLILDTNGTNVERSETVFVLQLTLLLWFE